MRHLALLPETTASSAREIAEQYDIPVELLAKVLQRLSGQGLVVSHQGTRRGYHLARPAKAISVADVIQAIDGPVTVTACSEDSSDCDQYEKCSVRDPLWRIKGRIIAALSACTIFEMATDAMKDEVLPEVVKAKPDGAAIVLAPMPD